MIFYLFIYVLMHGMWDCPTRDQTCASCIGSMESYLLDHQGLELCSSLALKLILI